MDKIVLNFNHDERVTVEDGPDGNIWISFSQGSYAYPMTKEEASYLSDALRHVIGRDKPLTPVEKVIVK